MTQAKNAADGTNAANARREKLAAARLEQRDAVLAEIPEFSRIAQALRELGESAQHEAVRREILALTETIQRSLDLRQQQVDMLAGPGISELLLPFGVAHRLQEADIVTVEQVRRALADGGAQLRRLPAVGEATCDVIRAHLEALDADKPPPAKIEIRSKKVTLTMREKVLAEKMGLSAEQAGELLKSERAERKGPAPKE
ncbi:hypothetical protein [Variovorax sp. PBL-E5]|uniref:hypothetical protein n=1 Tax=Variovorax sp. PBL-E5 TaxID=434014 RepID=UPI001316DB83|nr:hypothetical protein [Variovorax sp. PBL-E5]VTU28474.1 hypothetical protein E5CHR_02616 [Variovorax sp. PBL-E5]